jgi:putative SOS response-associated peptidase YedK
MCGRFVGFRTLDRNVNRKLTPNDNVAPTQQIPVARCFPRWRHKPAGCFLVGPGTPLG